MSDEEKTVPEDALNPRWRGEVIGALMSSLQSGESALSNVPKLLRRILEHDMWRDFETPTHAHVHYDRFEDFVTAKPSRGLGADIALVRRIVSNDLEAVDLLDRALQHSHGGDRSNVNNINVADRPQGTSADAALRRLRKDRPDLHERVLAGEMTPHGAMVEAGFRKPTASVPKNDVPAIERWLRKNLNTDQIEELVSRLTGDQP